MQTNILKMFLTVAECGSFEKACREYFLSSTALSRKMRNLEEEMGVTLFSRSRKGVALTPAGEIVYQAALQMLETMNNALEQAKALEKQQSENVRVGTSLLNPFNEQLYGRFPYSAELFGKYSLSVVPIECSCSGFAAAFRALGREIDFIPYFLGNRELDEKYNAFCLVRFPFVLAVPTNHPLAAREEADPAGLNGEEIVTLSSAVNLYYARINAEIGEKAPEARLCPVDFIQFSTFDQAFQKGRLLLVGNYLRGVHPLFRMVRLRSEQTLPFGLYYSKSPSPLVQGQIRAYRKDGHSGRADTALYLEV